VSTEARSGLAISVYTLFNVYSIGLINNNLSVLKVACVVNTS